MPALTLSVPHTLGQDEATERLRKLFARLKEKFEDQFKDLEETWEGHAMKFGFKTFGFKIKGQLAVEPEAVNVDGELPFAAMMFKGRIENEVREALQKALA